MIFCHALLSEGFFFLCDLLLVLWWWCLLPEFELGRVILGRDDGGGELEGGSNRSDKSDADPGENGESKSMSMGDPPDISRVSVFNLIGRAVVTLAGSDVYK